MKSKNVRLPLALVEALEKRNTGKPPGDVLLDIYMEYESLEGLASSIRMNRKDLQKASVYEVLVDRDNRINEMKAEIDELKKMLQGLQIFFTKVKAK
ncbi:MAG: hypothetical protein V1854_03640 [Methanobacteriota archaeon]